MKHALIALLAFSSAAYATPPSIYALDGKAVEGSPVKFSVRLVGTTNGQPSTASYVLLAGTAHAGTDYVAAAGTISLSPQATVIPITTVDNATVDGTRTFKLVIRPGTNTRCYRCTATGTITDNDVAPPAPQWVPAPLVDGGFARCKTVGGCHNWTAPCPLGTETFPPTCNGPNIIARQGDVLVYAWNGCSATNPCRYIGAFWPQGKYKQANVGFEGWIDEWEGVKPTH